MHACTFVCLIESIVPKVKGYCAVAQLHLLLLLLLLLPLSSVLSIWAMLPHWQATLLSVPPFYLFLHFSLRRKAGNTFAHRKLPYIMPAAAK